MKKNQKGNTPFFLLVVVMFLKLSNWSLSFEAIINLDFVILSQKSLFGKWIAQLAQLKI